jgi:hypothetical protein
MRLFLRRTAHAEMAQGAQANLRRHVDTSLGRSCLVDTPRRGLVLLAVLGSMAACGGVIAPGATAPSPSSSSGKLLQYVSDAALARTGDVLSPPNAAAAVSQEQVQPTAVAEAELGDAATPREVVLARLQRPYPPYNDELVWVFDFATPAGYKGSGGPPGASTAPPAFVTFVLVYIDAQTGSWVMTSYGG